MKKIISIVLLIVLGIGVLSYPYVSNWISVKNASYIIQNFDTQIDQMEEEKLKEEWEKAQEYNDSLEGTVIEDPFVEGSGMALQENYKEVLNIDGIMGYVEIPKIKVKLSIYHGTDDATLRKGAGHLEGTSLPIGGIGHHAVLTGHTGLTSAKLFTDLTDINEGDSFYLHILDKVLAYQVDQVKVVEPENTEDLERVNGKDYVSLVTCTPYGVNSHRLLVRGERTDYVPQEEIADEKKYTLTTEQRILHLMVITAGVTLIVLLPVTLLLRRIRRRQ